jgi:hypothetical protein
MSNVGDVYLFSGDSSKTLYLGYSSYPFGKISLNGAVSISVGSSYPSGVSKGSLFIDTDDGSFWKYDGSSWNEILDTGNHS